MKILLISESYPPRISGVAVVVQEIVSFLCRKNQRVVLFTNKPDKLPEGPQDSRLKIYYFPTFNNPFKKTVKVSLPSRRYIRKILSREKPDVIHSHDPSLLAKITIEEGRKLNRPIIITHHFSFRLIGSYLPGFLQRFLKNQLIRYLRKLYQQANIITTPSKFSQKEIQTTIKITTPIVVLANGIDLNKFKPAEQCKAKTPIILYVGRLAPEKEVDVLVKAAAEILLSKSALSQIKPALSLREPAPIKFYFVGKGELLPGLQQEVKEKYLTDNIHFFYDLQPGSQQLIRLYQKAWVFWTASRSETQGIVVLEAMATGLPVIAPSAGGIPEMLKDNYNGLLVEENTPAEFKEKLLYLLGNPTAMKKFSQSAIKTAQEYELNNQLSKFLKIYLKLK